MKLKNKLSEKSLPQNATVSRKYKLITSTARKANCMITLLKRGRTSEVQVRGVRITELYTLSHTNTLSSKMGVQTH